MGTGSTERRNRKRSASQTAATDEAPALKMSGESISPVRQAWADTLLSERAFLWASLAIMLLAAFLRLYALELKPMHHDEGVNGFFLTRLLREGIYQYDPQNYHGPVLYYLALVPAHVQEKILKTGMTTFAIRASIAAFGLATIWLVLLLRRYIGALGALTAAALVAVSPGMVFNSRYFIHETLFVFFTLGIVVAVLNFYERRRPTRIAVAALGATLLTLTLPTLSFIARDTVAGSLSPALPGRAPALVYLSLCAFISVGLVMLVISAIRADEGGRFVYLLLAFVSAALLFATKETAFISVVVLGLATIVAWTLARFARQTARYGDEQSPPSPRSSKKGAKRREAARAAGASSGGGGLTAKTALWLLAGVALFVFLNVIFYSSFYTYTQGVSGSLEALKIWTKTGTSEFHKKPLYNYLVWLWQEEAAVLLLAFVGALVAVFQPIKNRFAIFAAAWAFGILTAYSLVPYKTPWLAINFIVPLAITAGYAIEILAAYLRQRRLWTGASGHGYLALPLAIVAACLALALYQSFIINFRQYDNDRYPYVYAHTKREFEQLIGTVETLAGRARTGRETKIAVASPDYWPLPWYLRDYKHVGYFGQVNAFTEPLVIANQSQEAQVQSTLGATYTRVGRYPLRPGVDLVLYARRDLSTAGR